MIKKCSKPDELKKYGQLIEKAGSYDEWEELNDYIEDISFEISECKNKCDNNVCQGLQIDNTADWQEEQMDNMIRDTLPDDDYFEMNNYFD